MRITQAMIAEHLVMDRSNVSKLQGDGVLPTAGASMDEIREIYIRHLRKVASGYQSQDGSGLDLTAERAALARAQRQKLEREQAIQEGKLLLATEVEEVYGEQYSRVRNKLQALPSRMAPVLAPVRSIPETQQLLNDVIEEVCSELTKPCA